MLQRYFLITTVIKLTFKYRAIVALQQTQHMSNTAKLAKNMKQKIIQDNIKNTCCTVYGRDSIGRLLVPHESEAQFK